jgi:uncharacterized protein YaaN involved in tellurite resistance
MTDLHEKTKKEIEKNVVAFDDSTHPDSLVYERWIELWEQAHRQRCEELEKLQKEKDRLDRRETDLMISCATWSSINEKLQKENSELRKGIEEVIDLCENGYSEEIMLRKLRSLVKKEVK